MEKVGRGKRGDKWLKITGVYSRVRSASGSDIGFSGIWGSELVV